MINYKEITILVKKFKRTKDRVQRNKLITSILSLYDPIIRSICNKTYNPEETRSIFILQLMECIDKFDPKRKISFNTFAYVYFSSIIRQSITATGYFKYKINTSSEHTTDDFEFESDFIMDLQKILTPEEIMVYRLNINKNIANNKLLETAKEKINKYLFE